MMWSRQKMHEIDENKTKQNKTIMNWLVKPKKIIYKRDCGVLLSKFDMSVASSLKEQMCF